MLAKGPDPLTRQLVIRTGNLLSKAATAIPRWLSAPLQILNPSPLADSTIEGMYGTPGTPEYIENMKSVDDNWKNYDNSLLKSKDDKRDKRVNRTTKMEELRVRNAQAVADAEAKATQQRQKAEQQAQQKAQQKAQEKANAKVAVDNKGNKGYTGQGNQSRAGNRTKPAPTPSRGGTSKNYGVTGRRVTGGR